MIVTRESWGGTTKRAQDNAARYNSSDNTLVYFPCDSSEASLYDAGSAGLEVSDAAKLGFGAVASLLSTVSQIAPQRGTMPTVAATDSCCWWCSGIPKTSPTLFTAVIGQQAGNDSGFGFGGGAGVAMRVHDGATFINSAVFTVSVTDQALFRALVVNRPAATLDAYESINGAAVSLVGTVSLGALGAVTPTSNVTLGGGVAQEVYGMGLHKLTTSTLGSVLADLDALRQASTGNKRLPNGW